MPVSVSKHNYTKPILLMFNRQELKCGSSSPSSTIGTYYILRFGDSSGQKPVRPRGLGDNCDTQLVINSNPKHIVLRTALESVLGCHMGTKKGVALGSSVG